MTTIRRDITAPHRKKLSRPIRLAMKEGIITKETSVFDYGEGRGTDVKFLREQGIEANGFDPYHSPDNPKVEADVVNLGYIINIIEDVSERKDVMNEAFALARQCLLVAARSTSLPVIGGQPYGDGQLTRKKTFQKPHSHSYLRRYIGDVLPFSELYSIESLSSCIYAVRRCF